MSDGPAFLFDLDGTLVDSVYQHVLAWRLALEEVGIDLSVWRIHRRIGMSGGLFINALLRETEMGVTPEQVARLQSLHAQAYQELAPQVRPAWVAGAVDDADFDRGAVGNRHQRPLGRRGTGAGDTRRARGGADRHPRSGIPCQTRPGSVSGRCRAAWG